MDYRGKGPVLSKNDLHPSSPLQGRQYLLRKKLLRKMMYELSKVKYVMGFILPLKSLIITIL